MYVKVCKYCTKLHWWLKRRGPTVYFFDQNRDSSFCQYLFPERHPLLNSRFGSSLKDSAYLDFVSFDLPSGFQSIDLNSDIFVTV